MPIIVPASPSVPALKFSHGEVALISHDGQPAVSAGAGFDPSEGALYLPAGTPVLLGDSVIFRDALYRVTKNPEVWQNPWTGWEAGVVAYVETGGTLPDTAVLERAGAPAFDPAANTETATWTEVWSGPCLVDAPGTAGTEAEAGEQRITVQPFTVWAPLSLVDIRPDDRLTVQTSADPRLVGLPLQVTRVKGASVATLRAFSVIDNQG